MSGRCGPDFQFCLCKPGWAPEPLDARFNVSCSRPFIPRIDVLAAPPCWWAFRVDFASPRLSTNHRALTERGTGLGLGEYSTCVLCGIARSNRLTVRFARGLTVGIIRRQESLSSKHVHTIHCSAINRDTINLRDCICLDDNIIQVIYRRFK
jgi:hypothetical protein